MIYRLLLLLLHPHTAAVPAAVADAANDLDAAKDLLRSLTSPKNAADQLRRKKRKRRWKSVLLLLLLLLFLSSLYPNMDILPEEDAAAALA